MYPYDPRNSLIPPKTFTITLLDDTKVNMCIGVFDLIIDGTDILVLSYNIEGTEPWLVESRLNFVSGAMEDKLTDEVAAWNVWLDKFDPKEQVRLSELLQEIHDEVHKITVVDDRLVYAK